MTRFDSEESDPISGWTPAEPETEPETQGSRDAVLSTQDELRDSSSFRRRVSPALETQDGEPRGTVIPETPRSASPSVSFDFGARDPETFQWLDATKAELHTHNRELRDENYALRVKVSKLEAYEKLLTQSQ